MRASRASHLAIDTGGIITGPGSRRDGVLTYAIAHSCAHAQVLAGAYSTEQAQLPQCKSTAQVQAALAPWPRALGFNAAFK